MRLGAPILTTQEEVHPRAVVNLTSDGVIAAFPGQSQGLFDERLFLYGDNDQVIPVEPTEAVAKELDGSTTVIRYPGGYHMLLRDLEAEPRWNDVLRWIEKTNLKTARTADSR